MKHKFLLLAAMMLATMSLFAQSANNEDEVVKIDRWNQQAYREGEILVKFRAEGAVQMRAPRKAKFQTSQVSAIDQLFTELGVDSIEQLMPMTGHKNVGRRLRTYNGSTITTQDLSKLYRLTLKPEKARDIHAAIERLKAMDEVEFAEPNYIVYTMALPYNDSIPTNDSASYVNESPLYSQQWGLQAINLPALWNKPKRTNKRPVIAILDTGVDIEHPDLAANIWTNQAEANGVKNQDDDANGFKDDLHGWDFINNHSVTNDFNGHGTHCAGIAAAVGKNGIGICGANPDALIMPVTVMQSNGTGDVATIVKGIDYAAANGADVISMSIGSYGYSMAEEQALGRAYANAVLVAAAGNDGHDLTGYHCPSDAPMFPAAFTFVLGVEASSNATGNLATFSNFDADGPIYSTFGESRLYNYELRAPGVNILSTFPGGRYKKLNGTSMACPLIAGAISRLIQCKEILSQELLFGDLIHMRQGNSIGNIDILATYNITDADRHPELALITTNLTDTTSGDGDYRADAGETIEFYPIFKNAWGQAENIRYWIKVGFDNQGDWVWDDTTLIHALQDTAYFGKPLSSYAKATAKNPYRMTISPDCADGRKINMTFFAVCDNAADTLEQTISIEVENGIELGGLISEDMTLYPNMHYIVTSNIAVPAGVTLTIKPGTTIKFKSGSMSVEKGDNIYISATVNGVTYNDISVINPATWGRIVAKGTKDSLIIFQSNNEFAYGSEYNQRAYKGGLHDSVLVNADIDLMNYWEYIKFDMPQMYLNSVYLKNCIIQGIPKGATLQYQSILNRCTYADNGGTYRPTYSTYYTNVANNHNRSNDNGEYTLQMSNNQYNNNFYPFTRADGGKYLISVPGTTVYTSLVNPNYYGSSKESVVRKYVKDIQSGHGFAFCDLSPMLTRPVSQAHGIVWKILVDGIDAQDEFDMLPPIGVGTHKCDVYFNRPMDISVTPSVSFGVRQPYTQHQVNENGSWSADSTIYTAFFTIDAKSVTDGLNTFKVYGAEDDEHFPVPEENFRFQMEVAATGSMSTGLMAEAGLGKVTLNWETDEEDFADLLGYNIYRWTQDTIKWNRYYDSNLGKYVDAGWKFDTICINSSLIDSQDTAYVDYNVVPGKAYYYQIRQVTTSLNTYDISNPVTATPLTAIKGDANGSMAVDVADVITEVNYITHQNPQPFIFEAADVNSDNQVNVIDVVGTVNLILHPNSGTQALNDQPAHYYIENGILYVETDVVLGGVQCTFNAEPGHTFTVLDALQGFETVSDWQTENDYLFLAYSMSGKTLGVGRHALLQIGDAEMTNIVLSDAQGHNVQAVPQASTALDGTIFLPCSEKYIRDCNFYIKIGDRIYNAMGQQVK